MTLGKIVFAAGLSLCLTMAGASPRQGNADWTPPETAIRQTTVNLGKFLLKHGMGDPRGGQFGVAKVVAWQNRGLQGFPDYRLSYKQVDKFGWQNESGGKRSFVGIGGLVYPSGSFEPKDLAESIKTALDARHGRSSDILHRDPQREAAYQELLSDRARMMILITGNTDLAELQAEIPAERRATYVEIARIKQPDNIRAEELESFVRSLWQQAVVAHSNGDSEQAVRVCQVICENRQAYQDKLASTLDFKRRKEYAKGRQVVPFAYLNGADVLLADNERRLREGPAKLDLKSIASLSQCDRIAKLIGYLDQIVFVPPSFASFSKMNEDRIANALIKEGKPAVSALIDCIYHDSRLTRGLPTYIDSDGPCILPTVKDSALAIFSQITNVEVFCDRNGWLPTEAEFRQIWNLWKDMSREQRCLSVLKENRFSEGQQDAAAQALGSRIARSSKSIFYLNLRSIPNKAATPSSYPFKSLTAADQNDLVKTLVARIRNIVESSKEGQTDDRKLDLAFDLSYLLNAVSPEESWPMLHDCIKLGMAKSSNQVVGRKEPPFWLICRACSLLADAGDTRSTMDYLKWLQTVSLPMGNHLYVFGPLDCLCADKAEGLVGKLVSDSRSGSSFEMQLARYGIGAVGELAHTPLAKFPSFRRQYRKLMMSQEPVGTVVVDASHRLATIRAKQTLLATERLEPADVVDAYKAKCRVGDVLALALSKTKSAPEFKISWPAKKKDEAIKELAEFLEKKWMALYDQNPDWVH